MEKKNSLKYKFLFLISTAYLAVDINIQGFLALFFAYIYKDKFAEV